MISDFSVSLCGLTREWIDGVLKGQNLTLEQVFIMTADKNKNYNIVKKEMGAMKGVDRLRGSRGAVSPPVRSGLLATERSTKDLEGQLNEVQRLADEDKIEEAIEMSRQIEEDWHSAHEFLSTFIEHSRLEQIDQSMAVLTVWLEQDNAGVHDRMQTGAVPADPFEGHGNPNLGNIL